MEAVLGFVAEWFGGNPLARLYLILVAFDTLSGGLVAVQEQDLNSSVGTNGLLRKLAVILGIGFAEVLEPYVRMPDLSEWCAAGFCFFEGNSILENLNDLGVPIPVPLRDALGALDKLGVDGKDAGRPDAR